MATKALDACPVDLRGIVPSLNTPFTEDDRIDLEGLVREVDYVIDAGCAGLLVLAVAGESASLSAAEADRVAAATIAQAAGRCPVIVSVTAADHDQRCRRARRAADLGADGILCQPPAGLGRDGRCAALRDVASAGPGLLMIQDLDWQGGGLAVDEIVDLFDAVPGFASLKIEVVPAGPKYTRVLEATGGRLHLCGGWAVLQMIDALQRGVHAFMPTGMEPLYVRIQRAFAAGRIDEAQARHETLLPILAFANQHIDVSIRFFKRLRHRMGLFASDRCRPPVTPLDDFQDREAERLAALAMSLEAALLL